MGKKELKMNMTKVEEETMQRKGALAEREKEIDKVRSDLDRGLAQVESSFKDNASETSRIRSSLVAQQEELEQEQKLLSERIAVLRSQEQALADKKLALDKKTSDLADLESLLLLREKKVDEREMGLQHEKALIKKAQEQLEEREFSLEKKENEVSMTGTFNDGWQITHFSIRLSFLSHSFVSVLHGYRSRYGEWSNRECLVCP